MRAPSRSVASNDGIGMAVNDDDFEDLDPIMTGHGAEDTANRAGRIAGRRQATSPSSQ